MSNKIIVIVDEFPILKNIEKSSAFYKFLEAKDVIAVLWSKFSEETSTVNQHKNLFTLRRYGTVNDTRNIKVFRKYLTEKAPQFLSLPTILVDSDERNLSRGCFDLAINPTMKNANAFNRNVFDQKKIIDEICDFKKTWFSASSSSKDKIATNKKRKFN